MLDWPKFHLPHVSRTFHGRDIFAPVAAHLANGVPLETLVTSIETLQTLPFPVPLVTEDTITCHIIHIDIFGNATTDLPEEVYRQWKHSIPTISVADNVIKGVVRTYSDTAGGQPLALFGSGGFLEIAVRNGSLDDIVTLFNI